MFDGNVERFTSKIQDLEAAGVDMVLIPEIYGFDQVSVLGYIAAKTDHIELMTGIVNVYSRSPALIAQSAATIDALSGGRFTLGIGTSGAQVVEGWHGELATLSTSVARSGPGTRSPTMARRCPSRCRRTREPVSVNH
jgi:alkanesulfonate monooxygenase SsuD/methylene tetrahydromethanopterin reductase-like flavin-dependent oxidoreductase (luciferase family)